MPASEDYTIGWICGLTTELVAATKFLEKVHTDPFFAKAHDNNNYTRGEIGTHNVVVAVLPNGEYGNVSAATVARDMLYAFPNIKLGLFVGIGAGAPKGGDIRLGDVVVSDHGGVVEYDIQKALQTGEFESIRNLNTAPQRFETAIQSVETKYTVENGHKIESSIEEAIKGNKRLAKYGKPPAESDRLFDASAVHPKNDKRGCKESCKKLTVVPRNARDEDGIVIHYGKIASSKMIMKNAYLRDKFSTAERILCFETEACGLMNHYPCLIIRGICDYADSHANEEWHGFAAMAAAAYAKDVLLQLHPEEVERQQETSEVLAETSSVANTGSVHQAHENEAMHEREVTGPAMVPGAETNTEPKNTESKNLPTLPVYTAFEQKAGSKSRQKTNARQFTGPGQTPDAVN